MARPDHGRRVVTGPINGLGALAAPSAPGSDHDPLVDAIRGLLPERSAEDKARGEIPIAFGTGDSADVVRIPVLFSRANRAWQDVFKARMQKLVDDVEADGSGQVVIGLLTGATDLQLELLEAYNPERLSKAWMEEHATDEQILFAFLGVTAAAYPFVVQTARTVLANREVGKWVRLQLLKLLYSTSTSSSPPNTDGRSGRSKKS